MPTHSALTPVMTADEINAYLKIVYPQLNDQYSDYLAIDVKPGECTVRLNANERHLRPGNTVSGPCLFTLADIGGYVCVLSHIGREALAVTTSLTINFMRNPEPADLLGEGRLMKLGRALVVGDFTIWSEGEQEPVAHAILTSSLPRTAKKGSPRRVGTTAMSTDGLSSAQTFSTSWMLLDRNLSNGVAPLAAHSSIAGKACCFRM